MEDRRMELRLTIRKIEKTDFEDEGKNEKGKIGKWRKEGE